MLHGSRLGVLSAMIARVIHMGHCPSQQNLLHHSFSTMMISIMTTMND